MGKFDKYFTSKTAEVIRNKYEMLDKMNKQGKYEEVIMFDEYVLAQLNEPCPPKCAGIAKTKKDENPMNYNAVSVTAPVADETAKQRRYMVDRVERDYYKKSDDFAEQFNLHADSVQSPQEMAEYIKNGWFTIRGADKTNPKDLRYWSPYDALEFRKVPADKEGYEAAKVALKKARQDALDVIAVLPLDKGFEAMKAFADFTVTSK